MPPTEIREREVDEDGGPISGSDLEKREIREEERDGWCREQKGCELLLCPFVIN